MATIKEIRRRIGAVKSTQKITRAMQMVAAAKLRRAQENIEQARPFASKLDATISQIALRSKRDIHPLLTEREETGKVLLVMVTADSGLCGGFNANTIRHARDYIKEHSDKQIDLYCVGRKGRDYFRREDVTIVEEHVNFFNTMSFQDAAKMSLDMVNYFLDSDYERIDILYNQFKSAIAQILTVRQILPIIPAESEEGETAIEYIYEPDEFYTVDAILPYHIEIQMWRILLESVASEMGAKMTAMDSATENANDLLNKLTISYNRARQAQITKEISEIVGGAEGMKG